jgi:hypothetical protein
LDKYHGRVSGHVWFQDGWNLIKWMIHNLNSNNLLFISNLRIFIPILLKKKICFISQLFILLGKGPFAFIHLFHLVDLSKVIYVHLIWSSIFKAALDSIYGMHNRIQLGMPLIGQNASISYKILILNFIHHNIAHSVLHLPEMWRI